MLDLRIFDLTDKNVLKVIEEIKCTSHDGICKITPKDILTKLGEHNVVMGLDELAGSIQFFILKGILTMSFARDIDGHIVLLLTAV